MATQNIYDLTDTWNNVATTFTAIKMNATDTASAAGSLLLDLQVGGTSQFSVTKAGVATLAAGSKTAPSIRFTGISGPGIYGRSGTSFAVTSGTVETFQVGSSGGISAINSLSLGPGDLSTTGADVILLRDAANTLAQRNSTNAQAFNIYNTYTDASNYERGQLLWSSNTLRSGAEAAGTGSSRPVTIFATVTASVQFETGGQLRWKVDPNGHFMAQSDNTYDIGAAATRPRNLYMGSWIRMAVTTVASLPAAATAGAGARMMVSDALAPVFGSAVAGSGAVTVPVYSTGAAWNVG
jgi:hypothetical protein